MSTFLQYTELTNWGEIMSQMGQFRYNQVLLYVTDNDGDRISPIDSNVNIVGDGAVVVSDSNVATSTLTISLTGVVATQYDTDAGSAVPAANVLTVSGGSNINTSGAGSTVTVNLDNTVSITGDFTTSTGNIEATAGSITAGNGLTVSAGTITLTPLNRGVVQSSDIGVLSSSEGTDGQLLIASGTGAVSWNNLSSANASIGITNGSNSISLDITGTTDHAVQVGNSNGTISSIGVGNTGTVLIGNTGANPSFSADPNVTSLTATTVYGTTFDTNVAAAGVTLSGTTLSADGTDSDIDINITPKGSGTLATTELTLTTDLAVEHGGTGSSSLTDHGILLGSGTGAITATAAPSDGQLLIGSTGNDPSLSTLTAGTGIDVTNGSGSITLASTGTSINAQTGTSYSLVLSDAGKMITLTNSSAITLTVPPNSSVAFPTGTQILIYQGGAGTVTASPGSGVTINSSSSELDTAAQYSVCGLMKLGTDTWVFMGDKA